MGFSKLRLEMAKQCYAKYGISFFYCSKCDGCSYFHICFKATTIKGAVSRTQQFEKAILEMEGKNMNQVYDKEKRHQEILDCIHETYLKKNHDYGDSFHESVVEWGFISAATRMSDKWNRFKNWVKGGSELQVSDESIKDTLLDLANYCIMLSMEIERKEND